MPDSAAPKLASQAVTVDASRATSTVRVLSYALAAALVALTASGLLLFTFALR